MLDNDTKRRIDTARDILVGKVPDPKSQVEQITIALIYKFMDDMDQQSVEMGGKASFFTGEYEKYAWRNIFDPRMGGFEMLALYADAITRMSLNPNLPQLFRDIFKNAYLPYRDPETLRLFLKTINEFSYDHSERLGDAFEYLLSVLGSQGDAGQFRTPRHIIDFMVQVVKPQKHETILDPACGTAGFLISSYKYILSCNTNKTPGDLLTTQERTRLPDNFTGYDISPDMVRLSLVNMYLHGFVQPHIYEYDTLTSTERWNDYADVILANPPFMSPKGGIKPHKQFSVQSKRSEVLFVDYITEHLTSTGRGAVIVPEGIIFQSANAYKQLRKYLIEKNFLWAVVSLPAGVFQPYSGVKTSILFFDKVLAKKTNKIILIKVENDGFDLGAQRRQIELDDIPVARNILEVWARDLLNGNTENFNSNNFSVQSVVVDLAQLTEKQDFFFSIDRYINTIKQDRRVWPFVQIQEICEINPQAAVPVELFGDLDFAYVDISSVDNSTGKVSFDNIVSCKNAPSRARRIVKKNDVLLSTVRPNLKAFAILKNLPERVIVSTGFAVLRAEEESVLPDYLYLLLCSDSAVNQMIQKMGKGAYPSINQADIEVIQIPLPPLEIQRQIVDEIAGYQYIIDGARQVVENWKPNIDIELLNYSNVNKKNWIITEVENICCTSSGGTPLRSKKEYYENGDIPWIKSGEVGQGFIVESEEKITELGLKNSSAKVFPINTVLVAMYGATAGQVGILKINASTNQAVCGILPNDRIIPEYIYYFLKSKTDLMISLSTGGAQPNISQSIIRKLQITLPPIDIQGKIVESIELERKLVDYNYELLRIYNEKIQRTIARVWEE